MYCCLECGHIFDEEDVATWKESRGEYWGAPCYEEMDGCPKCHSDYAPTYRCNCCDEWIDDTYIKTDDGNRYCHNCYLVMELGDEE